MGHVFSTLSYIDMGDYEKPLKHTITYADTWIVNLYSM